MQKRIETDLEALIDLLPFHIQSPLRAREDIGELLEVVLDLGREPEARFLGDNILLSSQETTEDDIKHVTEHISPFGEDNRAGIERTLHRISAIRSRTGKIVGLTLRAGRAVYGTIRIIEDLVLTGQSILLLGKPGVGKTTMLREVARVLADDAHKRVVIVDTSNEIAGDGDIPHPGIGRARRMQVPSPARQHAVMIEAVENHMPEVIIIDEIGTEMDANAARTIAERGVQLVATAHGNTLDNLIINPTLSDLVGGVQTVTLGDVEARRRRTQKTVQERRSPPTFDILVEIQGWNSVAVHVEVADVVDQILRGYATAPEIRTIDDKGIIQRARAETSVPLSIQRNGSGPKRPDNAVERDDGEPLPPEKITHILPYGVNKGKLQQAILSTRAPVELVNTVRDSDLLITTKNYYRRRTQALRDAEQEGKPVYVLRKNTLPQIQQFIQAITRKQPFGSRFHEDDKSRAVREAEEAIARMEEDDAQVALAPKNSYLRHLQHQVAEQFGFESSSAGREPSRHVVIFRR